MEKIKTLEQLEKELTDALNDFRNSTMDSKHLVSAIMDEFSQYKKRVDELETTPTVTDEEIEYEVKLPPNGMRHDIRHYLSAKGTYSRKSHTGERRVFVLYNDAVKSAHQFAGQEVAIFQSRLSQPVTECVSCDEKKELQNICMECIKKLIAENQPVTGYSEEGKTILGFEIIPVNSSSVVMTKGKGFLLLHPDDYNTYIQSLKAEFSINNKT